MLIAMAGLPGTGKTTVAHALARATGGLILDKDAVRAVLFPLETVEYSREQDDLCVDIMLQVATFLLRRDPERLVILDGRTFTRRSQVETVMSAAAWIPAALGFIECTCAEATAMRRLEADRAGQTHPAANRDAALYRALQISAEPLQAPHLTVDTEIPLGEVVDQCVRYLSELA